MIFHCRGTKISSAMIASGFTGLLLILLMAGRSEAGLSQSIERQDGAMSDCLSFDSSQGRANYLIQLQKCASSIERQFALKWQTMSLELQSNILTFNLAVERTRLKSEALELSKPTPVQLMIGGLVGLVEKLGRRLDRKLYNSDQEWRRAAREVFSEIIGDFCDKYQTIFEVLIIDLDSFIANSDENQSRVLLTGRTRSLLSNARLCSTYLVGCISDDEIINAYLVEHPLWDSQNTLHSRLFSKDQLLPYEEIVKLIDEYLEFIQNQEMYAPKRAELLAILSRGSISPDACSTEELLARDRALTYYKEHVNIHRFLQIHHKKLLQLCRQSASNGLQNSPDSSSGELTSEYGQAFKCSDLRILLEEFELARVEIFNSSRVSQALRHCASSIRTRFNDTWSSLSQYIRDLATEFDMAIQMAEAKAKVLQMDPPSDGQLFIAGSVRLVENHGQNIARRWADLDTDWFSAILKETERVVGEFCNKYEQAFIEELIEDYQLLVKSESQTSTRGSLDPETIGRLNIGKLCLVFTRKQIPVERILEGYLLEHPDLDSIDGLYQIHTLFFSDGLLVPDPEGIVQLIKVYTDCLIQDPRFEPRSIELRKILEAREINEENCDADKLLRRQQMLWIYRDKPNVFNFLQFYLNEQRLFCKQSESRVRKGKAVVSGENPEKQITAARQPQSETHRSSSPPNPAVHTGTELETFDLNLLHERRPEESLNSAARPSMIETSDTNDLQDLAQLRAIEKVFMNTVESFSFRTRLKLNYLRENIYGDQSSIDHIESDEFIDGLARFLAKHVRLEPTANQVKHLLGQIECQLYNPYNMTLRNVAKPYVARLDEILQRNKNLNPQRDLERMTVNWLAIMKILDRIANMSLADNDKLFIKFMAFQAQETHSVEFTSDPCNSLGTAEPTSSAGPSRRRSKSRVANKVQLKKPEW